MDAAFSTPVGPFSTAVGASFATFTARQFVDPLPTPLLLPGDLKAGRRIKIEAEGEFGCTATPTLVWGLGLGIPGATGALGTPIVLAESSAITLPSGATAFGWRMEYRGIIVAPGGGTAASIVGLGTLEYDLTLSTRQSVPLPITAALRTVATIDTTIIRGVGVLATFNTSNAANRIQVYQCSAFLQN